MIVLDEVGMRIKHTHCPKCGSDNLEIVWRCEDPGVVSYICLDCKAVTKETAQ
jgi:transposase-like protein